MCPSCSKGRPEKEETWFDSSHPIDVVSLAIPDPKNLLEHTAKNARKILQAFICHLNYSASGQGSTERIVLLNPPSKPLKKFGKTSYATFTQIDVENIANECFLSEMDVQMWLENVKNGGKRKGTYSCKMPFIQLL